MIKWLMRMTYGAVNKARQNTANGYLRIKSEDVQSKLQSKDWENAPVPFIKMEKLE